MATRSKLTRQNSWRDQHSPFTKQELQYFEKVVCPSLPSFNENENTISSNDFQLLCDKMKWPRSPELMRAYERTWEIYFDGKITVEWCSTLLSKFHNPAEWFAEILHMADKDNDGFVKTNEYELLIEMLTLHAYDWPADKTFKDFVKEVDENDDGKISIEECKDWVEKHAPIYDD